MGVQRLRERIKIVSSGGSNACHLGTDKQVRLGNHGGVDQDKALLIIGP